MSEKPARHHHYVPQMYLSNFTSQDRFSVFNTDTKKLFESSPRNVASQRDLYLLEGPEPQLAEKMYGEVETAVAPILAKIIACEKLPDKTSDDFVSLLYFIGTQISRHPNQLANIEEFIKTVITRSVQLCAANVTEDQTLADGTIMSKEDLVEAVTALEEGKIRLHIPRDHSVGATTGAIKTIVESLLQRSWILAVADENQFITSTYPVLLCWDDLSMHLRHSIGYGLRDTTVYFPISPELMMMGKFNELKETCRLGAKMVAAVNGLHGIYSPQLLFSQSDQAAIDFGKYGTVQFHQLPEVFAGLKSEDERPSE